MPNETGNCFLKLRLTEIGLTYQIVCASGSSEVHDEDLLILFLTITLISQGHTALASVSDAEIKSLSETLYKLDHNRATASELVIDPQTLISSSETSSKDDHSSHPLFKQVSSTLLSKPTYKALLNLLDNYKRMTGEVEDVPSQEEQEQDTFLQQAMNTDVGKELYNFLHSKGIYSSQSEFIQDLKMMWFGLYSRSSGKLDSSGFEHIFAGEIKGGKVSGFHNWLQFYLNEKQGLLNYYSHSFNGPWTSYPDVLGMQFEWDGYFKEVGSAFIGSSPEFDLAIYSLCYITRSGKKCYVSLGGQTLGIQTYTWDNSSYGDGKKYIASAYPATP
ncbi:LOW QUALITY PROTEIN: poly(U)-specific endoribonuclease-A-like [Puntigrus tetrazona]|uniref:LOW QUALITY PROTEIN: poly(U)-specific endoribonuclease-A-like n=1 Tax=Puntigrus tetrazona TaxID=1606681 RepID=UPI001C89AC83|nr:LOW QUALITY PROTEIN: poly(U)-specific endoribonuclease-A-like [Puntigrus tetrazona]